jgi:hypothetical protein
METRLSLAPGQNGTKKLLARYGERLVCVPYRYDLERKLRHKTVELIVETIVWAANRRNPRREAEDMVAVRIGGDPQTRQEVATRGNRRARHPQRMDRAVHDGAGRARRSFKGDMGRRR